MDVYSYSQLADWPEKLPLSEILRFSSHEASDFVLLYS